MELNSKILVLGHNGMVGSAIIRVLNRKRFYNIVYAENESVGRIDLTNQSDVFEHFYYMRPEYVFLAAAKVGGIHANKTYPAQFIYNNLSIQNNVIEASKKFGAKKLLFLGSTCIYPRDASQPMSEEALLSGPLEPTNEYYAIAKIAGIKMCEAYWKEYGCRFISCQPTNLYGPNDNYDAMNSHVIPGMIRKFHEAKMSKADSVTLWGTGSPKREFLHVDDLANACILLMEKYEENKLINIGSEKEVSIQELSEKVKKAVDFEGEIVFDTSQPDGTPRKLTNSCRIKAMGWSPSIPLSQGLKETYEDFLLKP